LPGFCRLRLSGLRPGGFPLALKLRVSVDASAVA
jgi:hypothetical protein